MTRRKAWLIIGGLMMAALVLASCTPAAAPTPTAATTVTGKTTESTSTTTTTTTTTTAAATTTKAATALPESVAPAAGVTGPQYGGTINIAWTSDPQNTDLHVVGSQASAPSEYTLEMLGIIDWSLDRDVWDFQATGFIPDDVMVPHLASYEMPDTTTLIFNVTQGVHFHNKPPVNGREMTAKDVEYSLQRLVGVGEFEGTGGNTWAPKFTSLPVVSITATDKWTVVIKMSRPDIWARDYFYQGSTSGVIVPREVIDTYGDMGDWRNVVGTGPYMLTDVVSDSSYTFTKNQGYWANDPRHPENRLPYIDVIETLIIPDEATRLAGLRSGKVTSITTVSQPLADGLMRTNPDLKYKSYRWDGDSMSFNMTLPFWQDIRIRKAMQLALDNDAVVENYYKGFANPTPFGVVGPAVVGFHIPFAEWPADLQAEYGYDPVEAERLLDEAGLPRGADGIRFKTKYDVAPAWIGMDVDHAQLTKAYYAAVGIDLEINVLERGPFLERVFAHTYEGLTWARRGRDYVPAYYLRIMAGCGQRWNFPGICDPVFDAILDKADKAATLDEYKKHTIEADMYYIRQHWTIMAPYRNVFTFWQPWLGGFSGERNLFNSASAQGQFTRTWVEIDMKAKMGH